MGRTDDVSLDGQRFLMVEEISAAEKRPQSPRIILVQNWFEELKRLVRRTERLAPTPLRPRAFVLRKPKQPDALRRVVSIRAPVALGCLKSPMKRYSRR